MKEHLPECLHEWPDLPVCICDELRASEKRVADEIWGAIREGSQYKSGFEGGLDAAREAVEAVHHWTDREIGLSSADATDEKWIAKDLALNAIDALREKT